MIDEAQPIDWSAVLDAVQLTLSLSKVMCYLCGQQSIGSCEYCKMAVCVDCQHGVYTESLEKHYCSGCFSRHKHELASAPDLEENTPDPFYLNIGRAFRPPPNPYGRYP